MSSTAAGNIATDSDVRTKSDRMTRSVGSDVHHIQTAVMYYTDKQLYVEWFIWYCSNSWTVQNSEEIMQKNNMYMQ